MFDKIIRAFIKACDSNQYTRRWSAFVLGAITFICILALMNICYWLLSIMWNITQSTPFEKWGIALAITLSFLGSALVFYFVTRQRGGFGGNAVYQVDKLVIDQSSEWEKEVETDPTVVSDEVRCSLEQGQPLIIDTVKEKFRQAMKQAKEHRDIDSFAAAEIAITRLLEVCPESTDVAQLIALSRWELDKLRRGTRA